MICKRVRFSKGLDLKRGLQENISEEVEKGERGFWGRETNE